MSSTHSFKKALRFLSAKYNHAYFCHCFKSLLLNGEVNVLGDGFEKITTNESLREDQVSSSKNILENSSNMDDHVSINNNNNFKVKSLVKIYKTLKNNDNIQEFHIPSENLDTKCTKYAE